MSSLTSASPVHRLRTAAYVILTATLLFAAADLVLSVYPLRPGTVSWRFGVMGLAANAVLLPMVLLLLIAVSAATFGDRRILLATGAAAALAAALTLVGAGGFVLDALQMRGTVRPEAASRFDIASAQAFAKLLTAGAGAALLAVAAFRTARSVKPAARQLVREHPSILVSRDAVVREAPRVVTGQPASPVTISTPEHQGA